MTQFGCGWLSLREPLDAASRGRGIAETLNRVLPDRPIHITDLATGTGANLRYLSEVLGGRQEWCLIDHDRGLLDAIPARMSEWAAGCGASVTQSGEELIISGRGFECRARRVRGDLAADVAAINLPAGDLVSASALLDLVSGSWLQALARRCLAVHAPVLFALTYDGRMRLDPGEPEDERIRELVNRHQVNDKGFGKALGPAAAQKTLQTFDGLGYRVECERSDWHIGSSDRKLQEALLDTWLAAALEIAPGEVSALQDWAQRRRTHIADGRSELHVGHIDILGWIPG